MIDATLPALTLVFEGFISRNTAKTLMETYVGTRAGLRVLDGEIARGDGSTIDAVIWFSDLRGFTSLAQSRSEDDLLKLLNDYFGTLTDAIEAIPAKFSNSSETPCWRFFRIRMTSTQLSKEPKRQH